MVNRQVRPLLATPVEGADGSMTFDLSRMLVHLADSVDAPAGSFLKGEIRSFRSLLAPHGQAFFWDKEPAPGPEERWAIFLPIVRPNPINLRRIEKTLSDSNVLQKIGTEIPPGGRHVAWYHVDQRGVLITSSVSPNDFHFTVMEEEPAPNEAKYRSENGWLPPFLKKTIPPQSGLLEGCPAPHSLEIEWGGEFHRGEVLLVYRCDGEPRAEIHPYFFPFAGVLSTQTTP